MIKNIKRNCCGARLPVYALFAAAFFPRGGQNIVFLIYLIGVAMAVFTGLVLKHTLLRGEATPFVMELPPYHLPSWKAVGLRTYERVMAFIKRAGKIIIPIILILAFLNSLGTDGSFGNEDTKKARQPFLRCSAMRSDVLCRGERDDCTIFYRYPYYQCYRYQFHCRMGGDR